MPKRPTWRVILSREDGRRISQAHGNFTRAIDAPRSDVAPLKKAKDPMRDPSTVYAARDDRLRRWLLLREAVERAETPDQFAAIDRDDAAFWEGALDYFDGFGVVWIGEDG